MDDTIEMDYEEILQETNKAILLNIDDVEIWIPRSQIFDIDENNYTIEISRWFAEQEFLI